MSGERISDGAVRAATNAYIAHADINWRDHLTTGIEGAINAALVAAVPEMVRDVERLREELLHTSRVLAAERATCTCDVFA